MWSQISRRSWLRLSGLASVAAGGFAAATRGASQTPAGSGTGGAASHHQHAMGTVGRVTSEALKPSPYLRAWNFSDLAPERRDDFYRETPRPDGSLLREYQ